MKIAFFTDKSNAKLFAAIFRRYKEDITVLYVFETPWHDSGLNDVHFFDNATDKAYDFIIKNNVEFAIVYGWKHRIPTDILYTIPFYNIHPSLLPKYRGPIPIIFQLLNNVKQSGVTIHQMDEYFDTGPICMQREFSISDDESLKSLSIKITRCVSHLLNGLLGKIINSDITLYDQAQEQASYCSYKDLNKYIVNNEMSYSEFLRIFNTLYGNSPIRVNYNGRESVVRSYSEDEGLSKIRYNLADRDIYLEIRESD